MNDKRETKRKTMNCKIFRKTLPVVLLDPNEAANPAVRAHLAQCSDCAQELASYDDTLSLLDLWSTPDPSPYFDQKLAVRLREAQSEPNAGWFERLGMRLRLNTGRQLRPALVTALALVLVVGGGGFSLSNFLHPQSVEASATVTDLQRLGNNEQALQQMDQLLQDDEPAANKNSVPPQS